MEEFAAFYGRARDPVYRVLLCTIGDRDQAEEALAEAFARALARWDRLAGHPNPSAWVARTALNTHRSWWRRRQRELTWPADAEPLADGEAESVDQRLVALVRRLPLRQRQVLALRVLLELSTAETAGVLGLAPKTVTVHLHRALATLRTAIDTVRLPGGQP